MKTLLIIRHAKSETSFTLNDFDRNLNERGKKDAPEMAERLLEKKIDIDLFISSSAKRAKRTAELFCEAYKKKEKKIQFVPALYHASLEAFYSAIEEADDKHDTVAVFSHNPGITAFVNELVPGKTIDNLPTSGIYAVRINTTHWKDLKVAQKDFLFFDYPKNG